MLKETALTLAKNIIDTIEKFETEAERKERLAQAHPNIVQPSRRKLILPRQ